MRRVPAAVTVVTAALDGVGRGMTVGSFTSVSMDPLLVSFNVGKNSAMFRIITGTDHLVVHLLSDDQAHISERFAAPDLTPEQQLSGISHERSHDGIPILSDTLACIRCRKIQEYDAGDHILILAEVDEITHQREGETLLYYNTHYRSVGEVRDPTSTSSPKAPGP